jgi:hypothetical protein
MGFPYPQTAFGAASGQALAGEALFGYSRRRCAMLSSSPPVASLVLPSLDTSGRPSKCDDLVVGSVFLLGLETTVENSLA